MALVSKGPLPGAANATAIVNEDGNILFSWTDNTGTGTAKTNDGAIVVAYFPSLKQAIFGVSTAIRSSQTAVLETNIMHGHAAETWIGFLSEDEKNAANSVYTGRIEL